MLNSSNTPPTHSSPPRLPSSMRLPNYSRAPAPRSGEFLAELRNRFGNLGLAAAAYNAGPQRVRDFIGGLRGLPLETRRYVRTTTGHPVEYWAGVPQGKATEGDEMRPQRDLVSE